MIVHASPSTSSCRPSTPHFLLSSSVPLPPATPFILRLTIRRQGVSVSLEHAAKRNSDTFTFPDALVFQEVPQLFTGATDVSASDIVGSTSFETPVVTHKLLRPYTRPVVAYSLLVGAVENTLFNDGSGAVDVRAKVEDERSSRTPTATTSLLASASRRLLLRAKTDTRVGIYAGVGGSTNIGS